MKQFKKRLFALLCVCMLTVAAIPLHAEEVTEEAVSTTDLYGGLDPESVVLTVGEDKVPLKKAYFLVKFQQSIVQDMQKSVYGATWYRLQIYEGDRSFQDNMKESIMNLLVRMSLARQHYEEYGIRISKDEKKKIEETVDTFFASNSDKTIEAMMADEETLTEILTDYTLLCKLIAKLTKNVKVEYGEAKSYAYVYGSFGDDAGLDLDEVSEETESLIEAFNNMRSRAVSSGDLKTTAANAGYGTAIHTYFIEDENDELAEFNRIVDGLDKGEISEVVYVGDNQGVFIGCQQELDKDSLADAKSSLYTSEQVKVLRKQMTDWMEEAKVVIDETIWSQVTLAKAISAYRQQVTE